MYNGKCVCKGDLIYNLSLEFQYLWWNKYMKIEKKKERYYTGHNYAIYSPESDPGVYTERQVLR